MANSSARVKFLANLAKECSESLRSKSPDSLLDMYRDVAFFLGTQATFDLSSRQIKQVQETFLQGVKNQRETNRQMNADERRQNRQENFAEVTCPPSGEGS